MARALDEIRVLAEVTPAYGEILSSDALRFIGALHAEFNARRKQCLQARQARFTQLEKGELPDFLSATAAQRQGQWQVAKAPADLLDRRVEITGPVERKMMINALNSGANVFMADFEDANSPTWENVVQGQINCRAAVRRALAFTSAEGKQYKLNDKIATLVVRPRGWHLSEKHISVEGEAVSASLVDFALYFFHNAQELIKRGSGPYFYLPKMESHLEARLWNDVFNFAQDYLKIPRGTIRATVLIETILAAFEMEEILYELRDYASGLNAGRWDYIFSIIKKFANNKDFVLPDRLQVTMNVSFMKAYCNLLVKTCHKRGAHAMGGMAAFIPSRKDEQVNKVALAKVREDKDREAGQGFDGTWVAHPDLVPVAKESFDAILKDRPHQKNVMRDEVNVKASELLNMQIDNGQISEQGVRSNIEVGLLYIESWLRGVGAAAIHNLMEDAATAEISRAQLWQWLKHGCTLSDGRQMSGELYETICTQEMSKLQKLELERLDDAAKIFTALIKSEIFVEFLTIPAYAYLNN